MTAIGSPKTRHEWARVRKDLEREIKLSQKKSELLAQLSHEVRTTLNGIMGMLRLMPASPLKLGQKNELQAIEEAADSLISTVNTILDLAKSESGKNQIEYIEFDLEALLLESQRLFHLIAQEKGIKLAVKQLDKIPSRLNGDPGKIRQILLNLINNAIKFTPRGRVDLSLRVLSKRRNSITVKFEIEDTGIGIATAAQSKLFSAFTQANASIHRKFGGTGLGLSICKRLVHLMQGAIGLQSTQNKGSLFWFQLTLDRASRPSPPPKSPKRTSSPFNVLVVEDNILNQKVAVKILHRLGFQAEVARQGREALALLEKNHYDLILMDCQMPKLDGYQTTRCIREMPAYAHVSKIPIVAMTGYSTAADEKKCLELGMNSYITKPFTEKILAEKIEAWLPSRPPTRSRPKLDATINTAALKQLSRLDGDDPVDLLQEFIQSLFENAPRHFEKIRRGIKNRKIHEISQEIHSLKTSCAYLGARQMVSICRQIETRCGQGNFPKILALQEKLEAAYQPTRRELEIILKAHLRKNKKKPTRRNSKNR